MGKRLFVGVVDFVPTAVTVQACRHLAFGKWVVPCFLFLKGDFAPILTVAHGTEGPALLVVVDTVF